MKEKVIIGLNMKYFNVAFATSLLGMLGLFLPYVSIDTKNVSLLDMMTKVTNGEKGIGSVCVMVLVISMIVVALLGIINAIKTTVVGVKIWSFACAIQTIACTILLFASKSMIDGMGIFSEKFLVKNLGIGYWLCVIISYLTLAMTMKTAKINTGYIVLVILSVLWLFPILWIVLTSFREETGYYVGYFIPKGFTLDNYKNLFSNESVLPFGRWWGNTFIIAIGGCIINTIIVLATAFVLSRTRFTGRTTFMKILMVIGMFPGFMSMLAVYNILKGIGLTQSLVALIIVGAAGAAMGYHICKGFFDTIPKALDEAAIIDGATRWKIFTKITIPLSKPIIIYTILTNFLGAWSDYIFPSMLLGDKQASYTVAIGLKWMTDFRRIDTYYTQFAAGAILVAIPIVILFIWLQRFYVEGLSGSVKG